MDNINLMLEEASKYDFSIPARSEHVRTGGEDQPMIFAKNRFTDFDHIQHMIVNPDSKLEQFHSRLTMTKIGKWGQLKLFMTQIQFINKYWDPAVYPNPICIYIGAAPGSWWPLFADMYTSFEVHLYDPRDFDVTLRKWDNNNKEQAQIFLHQQFFTGVDHRFVSSSVKNC